MEKKMENIKKKKEKIKVFNNIKQKIQQIAISGSAESKNLEGKVSTDFNNFKNRLRRILKRFWGLTQKELAVLFKDRIAMIIAFLLPSVVIILLATYGSAKLSELQSLERGSPPSDPPIIGYFDADDSSLSHEFVALMQDYELNEFCILVKPQNTSSYEAAKNELLDLLGKNQINCILIIPPLFEYNLTTHFPALLDTVFDTIDTTHLQYSQEVIDKMVNEFKVEYGYNGVFQPDYYHEGVPEKGKLLFIASSLFFPMILFSIGSLTASQSIVSDIPKDRMVMTPTNKYEILAAKLTALQIVMSLLIILTVSLSLAFGLKIRGSLFGYFAMLFVMALSGVVWGLFISSLANVPLNAFQYYIFMFLFQTIVVLFIDNGFIIRLIPFYNGRMLLMNVTLRGEPLSWNFQYINDMLIETVILYIITQIIFNKRKNLL
ncbi:MAG: ABC transporter permease [Promethearchaeota archaeon]